eukprot:PhM_4_TR1342/c2_g2_i4/m.96616
MHNISKKCKKQRSTESLYDGMPYLPAIMASRRFSFLAHAAREHFEDRRRHACIEILFFDPEGVYPTTRSVRTSTVLSSLLAENACLYLEQLKKLMVHRPTSRQTVTRLLTKAHQQQQHRIWRRRFTSQLRSYFGISARDALLPPFPPVDPPSTGT